MEVIEAPARRCQARLLHAGVDVNVMGAVRLTAPAAELYESTPYASEVQTRWLPLKWMQAVEYAPEDPAARGRVLESQLRRIERDIAAELQEEWPSGFLGAEGQLLPNTALFRF